MTRRHLIIFAKAPALGRVKRRLAADLGNLAALRFYRATLTQLIRRVGKDRRWLCSLCVTPDRDARPQSWTKGLPVQPQGAGDLGVRMARAPRTSPPGLTVIVGGDIPEITAAHIGRAFALLSTHHAVFGPAVDGGYWLVGLRNRRLPYPLFRAVRWSTRHALADTLAGLPRHRRVALADRLHDIDDIGAFAQWRRRKEKNPPR